MEHTGFGLLFVLVLGAIWACDAGRLGKAELYRISENGSFLRMRLLNVKKLIDHVCKRLGSVMHEINYRDEEIDIPVLEHVSRKAKGCRLCEEYMTQTLDYLGENKTQAMVLSLDNLHDLCSRTGPLRQECITLADHYVPIFFLEASSVQPEEFCRGYHRCQQFEMGSQIDEIRDGICKRAVSNVLSELKDPDSQLQIIQSLFQACRFSNSVENHAVKCKRMVLMYGPQLLAEAVNFLETSNMCSTIDACKFIASSKETSVPHQEQSPEELDS